MCHHIYQMKPNCIFFSSPHLSILSGSVQLQGSLEPGSCCIHTNQYNWQSKYQYQSIPLPITISISMPILISLAQANWLKQIRHKSTNSPIIADLLWLDWWGKSGRFLTMQWRILIISNWSGSLHCLSAVSGRMVKSSKLKVSKLDS